jgi:hypothetical protein
VSLYDDALEVAKMYMGPAAQRFMSRQVTVHLGLQEAQLEVKHMEELAALCYKSSKLFLPEDKALQFGEKIKLLGKFS